MDEISSLLGQLSDALAALAAPLAIVGIVAFILAFVASPVLPDAVGSTARGYIQKALLAVAAVSFIPGIVTGLASLGG